MGARPQLIAIQYLRGIAAMMVVFHHAADPAPWFFTPYDGYGWASAGVDIFFVISGFIMYAAARDEKPADFAWRRIVRVVPLYWLATTAFILINFRNWDKIPLDWEIFSKSLFFIPYFSEYHGGRIYPYLYPGWTLNYEMFFYALFALALLTKRLVPTLWVTIGLFVVAGLAFEVESAPAQVYTNPMLLEFLAGVLLAAAHRRFDLRSIGFLLPLGFVGLVASDFVDLPYVVRRGVPALAIVAGALSFESSGRVPRVRFLKLVGDASYSLYLSHVIVLVVLRFGFKRVPVEGWPQFIAFTALALVVATAIGIAIHLWIEKPMLRALSGRPTFALFRRRPALETD